MAVEQARAEAEPEVLEKLDLVEPSVDCEGEFLDMVNDFREAGDPAYDAVPELVDGDFAAYVQRLRDQATGRWLEGGRVPATTYWLVRGDGMVIGASSLRQWLSPFLEIEGGHVGYRIRPSERRKGYGTRILALTLEKARDLGLHRVLVTCDSDNLASARIIQKNGGQFDNEVISPSSGKLVSRYWIDL